MEENEMMQPEETDVYDLEEEFADMVEEEAAEEPQTQDEEEEPPEQPEQPVANNEREFLAQLANEAGMTVEELIEDARRELESSLADERESKLKERVFQLTGQGLDQSFAQHVASLENGAEEIISEQRQMAGEEGWQRATRQSMERDMERFTRLCPEALHQALPEEVFSNVSRGMTPVEAYQNVRLEELAERLGLAEHRERNRRTTTGSAKGGKVGADTFMDAFMGVFKE